MAVELGSKIVKDTVSYNDYAIGITLPLQFSNNTFEQSFKTINKQNQILKTFYLLKEEKEFYNRSLVVAYKNYYLNKI